MNDGLICHKKIIGKFYDEEIPPCDNPCICCYVCIKSHEVVSGCSTCSEFLATFFPDRSSSKLSKSVTSELRFALKELFAAMSMKELKVENNLHLGISNFVDDFIKVIDEVKTDADIIDNWHISPAIASKVFSTLNNVLHGDELSDSDTSESSSGEDEDSFDEEDEDSSNTEEEDGDVESYIDVGAFDGY